MLYAYLDSRRIAHRKCGKLIVATSPAEEAQIAALNARALENEVENVTLIAAADAKAMEPHLNCVAALLSAETGVLDSHAYMEALLGDIEFAGGAAAFNTPVLRGRPRKGGGFEVDTGGLDPATIRCRALINAGGLSAQRIARTIEGLPADKIPPLMLAKGSYFGCAGKPAFSRLVYPAPVEGGLGVHLTLDLAGRMRFGPDVEWLDETNPEKIDYAVDPRRAQGFYEAIRRYWPGLPDGALTPDYAGCRPKLSGRGEPAADFRIDGPETHGLDGLVNLFGIESPGLTSSLAIAADVADKVGDAFR
jgi:L-2-hydroxyglutarate oxidase LhgO